MTKPIEFLNFLGALPLPFRRYFQGLDKVVPARNALGPVEWILARSLCRFRTFDFSRVPKNKRNEALRLELEQWSPYEQSGYYVGLQADQALVWCWDGASVQKAIVAQRLNPKRVRVLPETALQSPHSAGMRLVGCAEGFEGQFWRDQQLVHSRWWPHRPTAPDWLMFQRDAGVQPSEQMPEPPEPHPGALSARAWIAARGLGGGAGLQQNERFAVAAGVILLALPTLWYGLAWYKLERAYSERRAELIRLRQQAEPLLQARREALDQLARANALRRLAAYPDQLALMAKVAEALPRNESTLREWNYQQGQLIITVTSPNTLSSSFLVNALQLAGPFRNVKAISGRDGKSAVLQMEVAGS